MKTLFNLIAASALLGTLLAALPAVAAAEVTEVRLAKQYGLSYLPLMVMEEHRLVEKQAKKRGLGDLKITWSTLGSGSAMNDALLAGGIDFASGGVGPLVTLWAKSNGAVKGVAALDSVPVYLNTVNPAVKGIADLGDRDRIALPAVKVSIQAVVLQMAAAKLFGEGDYDRLDRLTVAMKHPDAMTALLSGRSEVTSHLASPPFMFQEQRNPRVRTILSSFDLLGGPHTFDVVWTTKSFHDGNPRTYAAVVAALEEAVRLINRDKRAAAELFVRTTRAKESVEEVQAMLTREPVIYTTTPLRTKVFADFMYGTGAVKVKAKEWKDLFFPEVHGKKGS